MNTTDHQELAELERLLSLCEVQSVRSGVAFPLGAQPRGTGVNFAVFSRHAKSVRLDFFDHASDGKPSRTFILDAKRNKTGDIWHVWVEGVKSGQCYGYRMSGPFQPEKGHRFNPNRLLIDPWAVAVSVPPEHNFSKLAGYQIDSSERDLSFASEDNAAEAPKSIVHFEDFDWQGDQPLRTPWSKTIVYELHVRGFTQDPSSGVEFPGTYRGLTEKIPYLRELGITAVELMPIQEFFELDNPRRNPITNEPLRNFWGYDPIALFSPKGSYAHAGRHGAQILEFKEMVRSFHQAGIEVILDVVFNHTGEHGVLGPTVSMRGIDNSIYYWLAENLRYYQDYTGTGHTLNASHPVVRDLILDSLRYWVMEMHVDGFRFDLASVLGRDKFGNAPSDGPFLERIAEDPILRDAKLIAEAWDAAGAYQVGNFSQQRWAEWNGRYRDDVRRFWRGDEGMVGAFATRITGSSDLYTHSNKGPHGSINFVTCHDGFTLNDLVSFNSKHNTANGEENRDGGNDNFSSNCGWEGPTNDTEVNKLRLRRMKNLLVTLLVSRGIPMLLAGDEFARTQLGNNNAYCQDNEISWVNWDLAETQSHLRQFVRELISFRQAHPILSRNAFFTENELFWLGHGNQEPKWEDPSTKAVGVVLLDEDQPSLVFLFNAGRDSQDFELPIVPWIVEFDTSLTQHAPVEQTITVGGNSAVILSRFRG
jgi:isoamylase